ncbi:MAG: EVE domain-containing protein [Polaromonas sp.]|nr:EVE domain-containing protein [Polaromonas sp.]MDP3753750.1 EVE domain-containing protein [Polaromonas sp.]
MNYWLMKSEPEECSVDDALAAKNATVPWVGVRNYQARNFMRDGMQIGDGVLFYHSSCAEPGIVGLARVASTAYPDPTQFDPQSPYYDTKSKLAEPRWLLVDVQVLEKIPKVTLPALRARPELADMLVLKKGSRLSITPVEAQHWKVIAQANSDSAHM